MKGFKHTCRKVLSAILAAAMILSCVPAVSAANGALTAVESAAANANIVTVNFAGGITGKITFLEGDIFRYNVDPSGAFSEYATTVYGNTVRIPQYPDSYSAYSHPDATVTEADGDIVITAGDTTIRFEKATAKMTVAYKGEVVMEEKEPLVLGSQTVQTLVKNDGDNFFGGGTQNGRFIHTGESINIKNESNWVDGGVSSPNPFYYSTAGYGVLRNTFLPGVYDFGKTESGTVSAVHNENEFDAYYFLSDGANITEVVREILDCYYHVTGAPVLLPEYAFYEGHLNAYNRDTWNDTNGTGGWKIYGSYSHDGSEGVLSAYKEYGQSSGYRIPEGTHAESLNGKGPTVSIDNFPVSADTPYEFSARHVIDQYVAMDMPLGYLLPNDGYGSGYGQNGYYMTGGVNADGSSSAERTAAVDANVQNLREFSAYAKKFGIEVGLWSQSYLTPDSNPNTYWHLLRDFAKEVSVAGVTSLKTDVAWVGYGYDMALNSQQSGYNTVSTLVGYRPNMITLDGWAGTQRFASVWTGDQYGGNWEYIRFHIPTYLGQSLSGNPNVGSDMDGIFGGSALIATRDTQWKIFTPTMLNMDGWGAHAKTPHTFGDPYTGIKRMYLKTKAQLLPYLYTTAAAATGIDTGNGDTGLPMVRAMFLEYPGDSFSATKNVQYQYMYGSNILVAPVYTETDAIDSMGNDVRNGIYLPDEDQIWIDYFTGDQYHGGQILNNFDAPIWKLPVFIKSGAIIPMWEENNSPTHIDKANRIAEFWPDGSTEYTLFEDEGTYVENNQTDLPGYGLMNEIDYGTHVSTRYTSVVENGTATLTAERSTGTYEGYDRNKNTTFIVNVSAEPTAVTAMNGDQTLTAVVKTSKEEVMNAELQAGEYAYYYDAAPAIETYAVEAEDEFIAMMDGKVSSPKLYVKFAETDSQANEQKLILEGFENVDADLPVNELDSDLEVPSNLRDVADGKTPTSNTIAWDAVEGATGYDVQVDGVVNNVGNTTTYTHGDQDYNSAHTYAVRARGAKGYSEWSETIEATTLLDPWRNVPKATITWNGGDQWGGLANATDHDTGTMFHSTGDVVTDAEPFIFDFGAAYELDKFEYYPRDNYSNGTVYKMDIYTSLDGVHWVKVHDGDTDVWSYDTSATVNENVKTVDLTGSAARYVKLIVKQSAGSFFAANELVVHKKDGTDAFAVGSTNFQSAVSAADYSNMNNYKGTCTKDGSVFVDQIQKRYGDINYNGVFDVYDYSFTAFPQDGGTKKTGSVSGGASYVVTEEDGNLIIEVMADNVRNVNAFGQVLNYDPTKLQFVSAAAGTMAASMTDFTMNMVYADANAVALADLDEHAEYETSAYVNLAYFNKGDQPLVNGSGVLAVIVMRGTDASAIDLSSLMLIGPDYSLETVVTDGSGPVVNITSYDQDDVTITLTNEHLPTDDGTNVNTLIQQQTYDGLFNETVGRDFEFMWDYEGNYDETGKLPEYVSLPVTMHVTFNEPSELTEITVFNANKSNGYATKAEATLHYSDGTDSEKINIALTEMGDYTPFEFVWKDVNKTVTSADITILEAINYGGDQVTNMLTLAELELKYTEEIVEPGVPVEYSQSDVSLTMTNEFLPTDDGSNVTQLIQQGNYNGLFNDATTRDFEFKWDVESNYDDTGSLPEYVTLPVTLHAAFNEASGLTDVTVYNANKSNGFVTRAEAVLHYSDGTDSETITLDAELADYAPFEFSWPDNGKTVTSVDITFLEAIDASGASVTNMLTLAELELKYIKGEEIVEPDESVEYSQSDVSLTMTNEFLPTDDGSNVTQLIQQQTYDGLFNDATTRDFEFKWDIESNYDDTGSLPEYVALPVTLHVTFNEASGLTDVTLYNANKSNGFATKAEAVLHYSDGTDSETITLEAEQTDNAPFAFTWPDNGKTVTSVDITILEAINSSGEQVTNMLTLAELELKYTADPNAEPPHEHSYEAVVTAPTCTEAGYTTYTCACGDSYVADETPALGHNFENGACTVCGVRNDTVAVNEQTAEAYATVAEALKAAVSGNTIKLMADPEEGNVLVYPGVTLDLNGHTLTAENVVGFNSADIVDNAGGGRLIAGQENVVLDEGNGMIPVYDGTGYVFTKAGFAIVKDNKFEGEGIKIDATAAPVNMDVVDLLKDGCADNNLKIMIVLSWNTADGTGSQEFVFTDEVAASVYSSNNGTWNSYEKMFSMIITGIDMVENLKANIMLVSGTNAEYASITPVAVS